MSPLFEPSIIATIFDHLFRAVVSGGPRIRKFFIFATISVLLGIIAVVLAENIPSAKQWLNIIAGSFGILGALAILGIAGYQMAVENEKYEIKVQKIEENAKKHPNEPQAAWELARIKLESYLNRNLTQVRYIFWLTLLVMTVGFIIIGYGIIRVYQSPDNFKPSIVAAISGLVIEFIAATFLLIYKSTVEQAKDYVNILERINAVGMAVQVLEAIEGNPDGLRDKTRAEIATKLLTLYSQQKG